MNRVNLLTKQAFALVLILLLSACAEDPLGGNDQTGKGHTITLRLSATVAPIPETKATIQSTRPGSEAKTAGFYSEMVSSDADRAATTPGLDIEIMPVEKDSSDVHFTTKALETKAPATLKNVYAFLFTSEGAFNGRANIGAFTVGTAAYIDFVDVKTTTATNCQLVVVANDASAVANYSSSTNFGTFSGTYADFQKLTITNEIGEDKDVPYAGSVIIDQSLSESGVTADVPLSWTLAKITLKNLKFDITDGPERSSITLYNAGVRRFATQENDNYDGTGSTETTTFEPSTASDNADIVTWYVGENIQPDGTDINSAADRNSSQAPKNACYIQVASAGLPISVETNPIIGEIVLGAQSLTYDYYLGNSSKVTDFALRRHTVYTIFTEISGTLAVQKEIAALDGRVTLTEPESAGLAIGVFGGPSGYTTGTGDVPTITGSYAKLLLLEPNTTRTTAEDKVSKQWSTNQTTFQTETRKYWDPTYTSVHIDQTAGRAADYCYNLTLGCVTKGTWYLPTHAQVLAMWSVFKGLQGNPSFANYSAFYTDGYWSSSEGNVYLAWFVGFDSGYGGTNYKTGTGRIRCVRETTSSLSAPMVTMVDDYPTIDISALAPLGSVLSSLEAETRRTAMYASDVTPSNSELLFVGIDVSGHNGDWNAKMSAKYQVMRANHSVGATDFATAWNTCKTYNGEGGSAGTWRLPTQRELDMIWILHPQLIGKTDFTAFSTTGYWCSTENDPERAWYMRFIDGFVDKCSKTATRSVRCVKDI